MCLRLQSSDGGRSAENTTQQHASQVNFLLSCHKPRNLEDLLDPTEIYKVVGSRVNSGEWKQTTGKLYCGSLKHFLSFILYMNENNEIPIPTIVTESKVILVLYKIPS